MDPTATSDSPLGTLLLRESLLTPDELEEALAAARASGMRLGELLLERGWVEERELARLVAEQEELEFVDLGKYDVDPAAAARLPEATARAHRAVAYGFEASLVLVAVADPADGAALEAVLAAADGHVRFVVAAGSEVEAALAEAYDGLPPAA